MKKNGEEQKRVFGLYLEPSIMEEVEAEAKEKRRSLSGQISYIIQEWVEKKKGEAKDEESEEG